MSWQFFVEMPLLLLFAGVMGWGVHLIDEMRKDVRAMLAYLATRSVEVKERPLEGEAISEQQRASEALLERYKRK